MWSFPNDKNILGFSSSHDSLKNNCDPNSYWAKEKKGWQKSNETDGVEDKNSSCFSKLSLSSCRSINQSGVEPKLIHMAASLGLTRYGSLIIIK